MKLSLEKIKKILLHILFWIGVWIFYTYFFSYNSVDKTYSILFSAFLLPITIALSYFLEYFLIPKFLLTKKYRLFALYGIYTFVVSTYLIVITMFISFIFLTKMHFSNMPLMSRNYIFILILIYLVVALKSFVSMLRNNFETISKNKELANKILENQLQIKEQELNYLKKQIHPHFLFNSLNTIYGLALAESKETPEVILKLSNLLDYILYQVNKTEVKLKSEIEHIKQYLEFEKIRFQDSLQINLDFDEVPDNINIAPMLIIPLVENVFKHGSFIDGQLIVNLKLNIENENLIFIIENSYLDKKQKTKHGIGLENLRKRLEMNYKNNFELIFKIENNFLKASLKIFCLNLLKIKND